jgi:exodeoxyribonuclease V gamma subunit
MAARPRFGDRSARNDDRFLFLESLISARDVFYVSYVGQGNKDNSEYPPSVLVSELLDYIASGYRFTEEPNPSGNREDIEKRLKIKHPLQAFSWRYFAADQGAGGIKPVVPLVSYSSENLHAAEKIFLPRVRKEFLTEALDASPEEMLRINLAELVAFFCNPSKYFLTKRLLVRPSIDEVPEVAESEKLSLNGLNEYKIAEKIIRDDIAQWRDSGLDSLKEHFKRHCRASGELSPGAWGEQQFESLFLKISGFAGTLAPHIREKMEPPVADIHFENGVALFARLEDIYRGESGEQTQILFRYANLKETDLIRAAVCHLAANLPQIQAVTGAPMATRLYGKDKTCFYAPVPPEEAAGKLLELLDIFIDGLCKPLVFFPASSAAYCKTFKKTADREKALAAALKEWEPGYAGKSDSDDDYFKFFYKSEFPSGEEFEQTAMLLGELLQLDIKQVKLEADGKEAQDA